EVGAGNIKVLRAGGGVNDKATKWPHAREIRDCGSIELADGTDQRVRNQDPRLARRGAKLDSPGSRVFVIARRRCLAVEFDVRTDAIVFSAAPQVIEIGVPPRIVVLPVVIRLGREMIEMVQRIA